MNFNNNKRTDIRTKWVISCSRCLNWLEKSSQRIIKYHIPQRQKYGQNELYRKCICEWEIFTINCRSLSYIVCNQICLNLLILLSYIKQLDCHFNLKLNSICTRKVYSYIHIWIGTFTYLNFDHWQLPQPP